jgi:hypothetical protein
LIRPQEAAIINPCDILLFSRLICFSFSLFGAASADFLIKLRLCPFDLGSSLLSMAAKEVEVNRQRCVQWEEGIRRLCCFVSCARWVLFCSSRDSKQYM